MTAIAPHCPKAATEIIRRLNAAGYRAYAVGGCIRDTLLGAVPNDWDITTSALPEEILAVFSDEHTIPTGIKHGTVTVMKDHVPYEVTTFRIDGTYSDSRHPESVTFSNRISDDLSRRDFTVNALAWNEEDGIVDCFSGIEDLESGILRAVGVPVQRFEEDALRILRGYRFAAQIGFSIEETTRKALISEAPRLKNISRERVSSEFCRLICSKNALPVLRMLDEDGIFPYVFPNAPYRLPAPEVLDRIGELPAAPEDRLAFLLRGQDPAAVEGWLTSLRLSNKQVADVLVLADPEGYTARPATAYDSRRLLAACGDLTERALKIASLFGEEIAEKLAEVAEIRKNGDCLTVGGLALGGKDLLALGIKGPAVGRMLAYLLDLVLHDPRANDAETLRAAAARRMAEGEV